MKRILALILSLFLLSVTGCATTSQEAPPAEEPAKQAEEAAEAVLVDFDLTGTWALNEDTKAPNCGGDKKVKSTVEITQKNNSATFLNKDQDYTWTGKIDKNMVLNSGSRSGKLSVSPYKLKVSADANTLTAKVMWDWDNNTCDGYTNVTYTRK